MISPMILAGGAATFIASLIIHILVWRILKPSRQLLWLILIFIIFPVLAYTLIFGIICLRAFQGENLTAAFFQILFALIWHCAISSAYIMTYPPIQAGCPSLKIIQSVAAAMPEGLTPKDIERIFSEDTLFSDRITDLEEDGLITLNYNAWGMTFAGRVISKFFLSYRKLLKLPLGEG